MKKKLIILYLFIPFFLGTAFAKPIVSAFGIPYKCPYEEGEKRLIDQGYTITRKKDYIDTSTDRKQIYISSCEYENIPYTEAILHFDKYEDGMYYFTFVEGYVDTDKINTNMETAAWYYVWLSNLEEDYRVVQYKDGDATIIGFFGDNDGKIILQFTDSLMVLYCPQSKY